MNQEEYIETIREPQPSIKDFFEQNVSDKILSLQNKFTEASDLITDIQNTINEFDNLKSYQFHMN